MGAYLLVFVGGGLGSICRYGIGHILGVFRLTFPLATFMTNALSCIVLGVLIGLSLKGAMSPGNKLLLMAGFCGGFSTFSTFTNETFQLFQYGQFGYALINVALSLLVCMICIYLGIKMVQV